MRALLWAVLLLMPLRGLAGTTAIVGGTVAIGDGSQPIPNGTVVFRDGRILAAGSDASVPAGATVIDARGKWVTAGLISAFTQLGIGPYWIPELRDSTAPSSRFSAAIDVTTAINASGPEIQIDRAAGITRAFVSPIATKTIFGGQGAVIDLSKSLEVVNRPRAFQYVELGQQADRLAGGSRPAAYAYFQEALTEARGCEYSSADARKEDWRGVLPQLDAAALVPVLVGKQPLLVHVERASDILHVLSLRQTFPHLRIVLLGASEGWRVARQIAAAHVPAIAAVGDLPSTFDSLAATESNVGRMTRAGVTVAVSTVDGLSLDTYLRQLAAGLVAITRIPGATGLDWGAAFAAIASKPAQVLGMDGQIGSLRPGRRADAVIWDGDPLQATSAPLAVYIDGVAQPLDNHLTKLRERYSELRPERLPKAYAH